MNAKFRLVREYLGLRLGAKLDEARPDHVTVVESARRVQREPSYGFLRLLEWIEATDGRQVISVPPKAGEAVKEAAAALAADGGAHSGKAQVLLSEALAPCLSAAGVGGVNCCFRDLILACDASLLRRHDHGDCRRLADAQIPPAATMKLPMHCFPDGIVYGVVADGLVVSQAYAHRTGLMEENVCDVGIETADGYRRCGYAQTALSALVRQFTSRGGEAVYRCDPENHPSIATARSVGFVPFGRSLILGASLK